MHCGIEKKAKYIPQCIYFVFFLSNATMHQIGDYCLFLINLATWTTKLSFSKLHLPLDRSLEVKTETLFLKSRCTVSKEANHMESEYPHSDSWVQSCQEIAAMTCDWRTELKNCVVLLNLHVIRCVCDIWHVEWLYPQDGSCGGKGWWPTIFTFKDKQLHIVYTK